MKRLLSLLITLFPMIGLADLPQTTQTGPLLKNAAAKGYSFEIEDMTFTYQPKFVQDAKVHLVFALKNIKKNGQLIDIADDQNDPSRVRKIINQFDQLCRDIFDINTAKIPEVEVSEVHYEYFGFKVYKLGCSVTLPAK